MRIQHEQFFLYLVNVRVSGADDTAVVYTEPYAVPEDLSPDDLHVVPSADVSAPETLQVVPSDEMPSLGNLPTFPSEKELPPDYLRPIASEKRATP